MQKKKCLEKFIAIIFIYQKKNKDLKINNPSFHVKKIEKGQIKHKVGRINKI